jgi:hypothetical protein
MAEPTKRNVDAVLISVLSVLKSDINEWVVEESDSDSRSNERLSDSEDSGSSVGDNDKIHHLLSQLCARPNLYNVKLEHGNLYQQQNVSATMNFVLLSDL